MPRATRPTDRRKHGVGDNTSGVVHSKANLQDQRRAAAYRPAAPGAGPGADFASGVAMAKPPSAGATVGQGTTRAFGKVGKLGGKD